VNKLSKVADIKALFTFEGLVRQGSGVLAAIHSQTLEGQNGDKIDLSFSFGFG
jgi:hypothetical protein